MKKTLTLLLTIAATTAQSQCFIAPCSNKITFSGVLKNKTYTGNNCFSGAGIIESTVSFNAWNQLTFNGAMVVQPDILMPGNSKVYASGAVSFNRIEMNGKDTVYLTNETAIAALISDNCDSTVGNTNVILLANSVHGVLIGNRYYRPGDTYQISSSRYVKIMNCVLQNLLPINDVKINSVIKLEKDTYLLDITVDAYGRQEKGITVLFTDTDGIERAVYLTRRNITEKTTFQITVKTK